jgi:uracil-DNA glycosylase
MLDLLREARGLIAFQRSLTGDWLPAGAPAPAPPQEPMTERPAAPTESLIDAARSPYERVDALIPDSHPVRSVRSLEELGEWLAANVLVPIDEERLNPVLGVGRPDADLMVVGEAPGADEDRRGEPFVGRAGQLLDKILESVGFAREDVYITNILKSRPPNNRDPRPEEVAAHIPMLYRQIAIVRPRLILCVGRQAGCGLLGQTTSLKALRGTFHDFHGLPLLVTYHPAALLRNPEWKRPTWEDVQILRRQYDQLVATAR